MATNKDFLYGLSKMTFAGKTVGYIEKDSFEWGGSAPESVDVEAEQVPDAPVLTLVQKNGTIAPKFNMIQLNSQRRATVAPRRQADAHRGIEDRLRTEGDETYRREYPLRDSRHPGRLMV